MPTAPRSRCSTYACPNLTPCPDHGRKGWANPSSSGRTGSTRRWRTIRARVLARHPACTQCSEPAVEVDHIIPLTQGGALYDEANLQPLCSHHHRAKTQHESTHS